MEWGSIRDFLQVPKDVTGKGVNIAVIDSNFPSHPDIISNRKRDTYIVKTYETDPKPIKLATSDGNLHQGLHGLWTASAAAGAGQLSNGDYAGIAPDAELYLIDIGLSSISNDIESAMENALVWVKENGLKYGIRGVVLTVVGQIDTGLLPWQCDPLRILCEEIFHQEILVVSSSGNTWELTSGSVISPSVLSVGGVIIPQNGLREDARPFPGSRGFTFDGIWNPCVLGPASNVVLPFPFESEEERNEHYTVLHDDLPENYARQWGTSYSAPIVLGLAACIWQMNPNYTASQVKEVLIASSDDNKKWSDLKAGLVSSLGLRIHLNDERTLSDHSFYYQDWRKWKEASLSSKVKKINQDDEEVLDILLSFLPERVPCCAIKSVKKCFSHRSSKVRTAAISVLTTRPSCIRAEELINCLNDCSPMVRMGGIHALNKCPHYWGQLSVHVSELINDENPDIRYNASNLASRLQNNIFIEPILKELEEEAQQGRIAIFGNKTIALEKISGHEIVRDPQWQEGEDPYSNRSIQALILMAKKWKDYFKDELVNVE